jgi:hypothetical protein
LLRKINGRSSSLSSRLAITLSTRIDISLRIAILCRPVAIDPAFGVRSTAIAGSELLAGAVRPDGLWTIAWRRGNGAAASRGSCQSSGGSIESSHADSRPRPDRQSIHSGSADVPDSASHSRARSSKPRSTQPW